MLKKTLIVNVDSKLECNYCEVIMFKESFCLITLCAMCQCLVTFTYLCLCLQTIKYSFIEESNTLNTDFISTFIFHVLNILRLYYFSSYFISIHFNNIVCLRNIFLINSTEADIMSATVLITFGALLGLASGTQLLFIAIIETAVGCINLYLMESVYKVGITLRSYCRMEKDLVLFLSILELILWLLRVVIQM